MENGMVRRPGLVTFIGVVLYIQAFLAAVAGIMLFAFQSRIKDLLAADGVSVDSGFLVGGGIVEIIMAIVFFILAAGVMAGNRAIRLVIAIVEGLRIVVAFIAMFVHHEGGAIFQSLVAIAIALFVLWALYAHKGADEYFEAEKI